MRSTSSYQRGQTAFSFHTITTTSISTMMNRGGDRGISNLILILVTMAWSFIFLSYVPIGF